MYVSGHPLTLDLIRELGREQVSEDFTDIYRVHDWRNYIPEELRPLWGQLSDEARGVAFVLAEDQASREDWE